MPVEDHPVHSSTRIDDTFRYGCHNRNERTEAYYAQQRVAGTDGYKPTWWLERIRIPFRMSRDCRYDMATTDLACSGCKWRKD